MPLQYDQDQYTHMLQLQTTLHKNDMSAAAGSTCRGRSEYGQGSLIGCLFIILHNNSYYRNGSLHRTRQISLTGWAICSKLELQQKLKLRDCCRMLVEEMGRREGRRRKKSEGLRLPAGGLIRLPNLTGHIQPLSLLTMHLYCIQHRL